MRTTTRTNEEEEEGEATHGMWKRDELEQQPPLVALDYSSEEARRLTQAVPNPSQLTVQLNALRRRLASTDAPLAAETSLLKKLLYKNWNALRKERSVQHLRRLHRLLARLASLRLPALLTDVLHLLTKQGGDGQRQRRWVSRELLECLLARLSAASALLALSIRTLRQPVARALLTATRLATFLPNNLVLLGTAGRLHALIGAYAARLPSAYEALRAALPHFKATGVPWSQSQSQSQSAAFDLARFPARLHKSHTASDQAVVVVAATVDEDIGEDIGECVERGDEDEEASSSSAGRRVLVVDTAVKRRLLAKVRRLGGHLLDDDDKLHVFRKRMRAFLRKQVEQVEAGEMWRAALQRMLVADDGEELKVLDELAGWTGKQRRRAGKVLLKLIKATI